MFFRHKHFSIKKLTGNSLGVQWLGLSTFTAMSHVQSTVGEIRSCKLSGAAKNNNNNLGLCFTSHDKIYFDRSWNKRKKWASIKRYALERIILFWVLGEKKVISENRKMSTQFFCFINCQETFIKQSALCIPGFHVHRFNQSQTKSIWKKKKIPESSREQNLNLPFSSSYLHSIYIIVIFTTICVYIVLGIVGKLLLLLLNRFSRVWLCATPQMAAHQAPASLGFSRQEHWSGLLFPSPMHESEKRKWSRSVVSDSYSDPRDCSLLGSTVHGIFQTRVLEWVDIAFSDR